MVQYRPLFQDNKSIVRRYSTVLDQAEQSQVEHEIKGILGNARVEVHFHQVDRDATIVVGRIRDSY